MKLGTSSKRMSTRAISKSGKNWSRQHWRKPVVCVICDMKPRHSFVSNVLLILVFLCAVSIGTATAQPSGRLIVLRPANFGWNLGFNLAIDGRPVGSIVWGRNYHTWLPAGHHVLTVFKVPRTGFAAPTSTTVNVKPGWSYAYTAIWDSDFVFLRPSGAWLTPGEVWQNLGRL